MTNSNSQPRISAAICTYNRADHLKAALDSLARQSLESDQFEIIVIDNCSTDQTADIINAFAKDYAGNFHPFYEENKGLSYARNRAIKEARGDFLAFLDDDAIAAEDWLSEILAAFESVSPTPGIIGGPVRPNWEDACPEWCKGEMLTLLFSVADHGPEPFWMEAPLGPVGANVTYDLRMLRKHDLLFDTDLGRIGTSLLSGEESDLLRRIRELDYGVYYVPKAWVLHWAPKSRANPDYAMDRYYWEGRSRAIRWFRQENPGLWDISLKVVKSGVRLGQQYAPRAVRKALREPIPVACQRHYWAGLTVGWARILADKLRRP